MKIADIKIALARKKLLAFCANALAEDSLKMGIILDASQLDLLDSFLQLKDDLGLADKEIGIIFCSKKVLKNDIFEYPVISMQDFRLNGRISGEKTGFLKSGYEVLVSFTSEENKLADLLVEVSRAQLKVGRKRTFKNDIFDLTVAAELSEPQIFTKELKKYLKILNTSITT